MSEEPDLFTARAARDEGIERVSDTNNAWMTQALGLLRKLELVEGTAEEIRLRLRRDGLPAPRHHNAWGALINTAIRRKILVKTGRHAQMRTTRSHARSTPVLRKVG